MINLGRPLAREQGAGGTEVEQVEGFKGEAGDWLPRRGAPGAKDGTPGGGKPAGDVARQKPGDACDERGAGHQPFRPVRAIPLMK
jgi:hypothetical protein